MRDGLYRFWKGKFVLNKIKTKKGKRFIVNNGYLEETM